MHHTRGDGRLLAIDAHHVAETEEAILITRIANRAFDDVARTQGVATNLLLGDENVFGKGEEIVLPAAQEPMPFTDDLKTAARNDRTAAGEIGANRGKDKLVLAIAAELLGIGPGHHPIDDLLRGPGLDVGETILGQIGIAIGIGNRLRTISTLVFGKRCIQKRIHRLRSVRPANRRVVDLRSVRLSATKLLVELLLGLSALLLARLCGSGLRGVLHAGENV